MHYSWPVGMRFWWFLPHSVDTSNVPPLRKRKKYNLEVVRPSLARDATLKLQFRELQSHSQLPIVMDRVLGPILSETWDDIKRQCMFFLGFVHLYFRWLIPT